MFVACDVRLRLHVRLRCEAAVAFGRTFLSLCLSASVCDCFRSIRCCHLRFSWLSSRCLPIATQCAHSLRRHQTLGAARTRSIRQEVNSNPVRYNTHLSADLADPHLSTEVATRTLQAAAQSHWKSPKPSSPSPPSPAAEKSPKSPKSSLAAAAAAVGGAGAAASDGSDDDFEIDD